MTGTLELFKDAGKKALALFRQYWVCIAKLIVVFFIPLWILDVCFWQNPALIRKIIDTCSLPVFVLIDGAVNFVVLLFFLLYAAAVVKTVYAADHGRQLGTIACCRRALSVFGPYIWVKTLFLFKVFCWSLLFVIPGVVYGVLYNFAGMALLVDGRRGKDALAFSSKIIRPDAGRYVACTAMMLALLYAAYNLFIFYSSLLVVFLVPQGSAVLSLVNDYAEIIFVAAEGSFFLVFYYYLYKALNDGKEGP